MQNAHNPGSQEDVIDCVLRLGWWNRCRNCALGSFQVAPALPERKREPQRHAERGEATGTGRTREAANDCRRLRDCSSGGSEHGWKLLGKWARMPRIRVKWSVSRVRIGSDIPQGQLESLLPGEGK